MSASVTVNSGVLARMLGSGPSSPGGRFLLRKAEQVAEAARVNAAGHGSIPGGIYVGPVEGKSVKVISSNIHTVLVHNGSRRHPITPRRRGGYLRFQIDGRTVYARRVNHPGYRGDPFLVKALQDTR